jgi:integration host factor subunit alpha
MRTATIGRANLIKKIAINNVTNQEASEVLEKTLEEISKVLASGEDVKISSFGTFGVIHKKERLGRNPRTGEGAKISSRRVISFRFCDGFKKLVGNCRIEYALNTQI